MTKKPHSKWASQSTQIDLSTSKMLTDKMVFDKLKKDFSSFFDKDIFYSYVSYASREAFEKVIISNTGVNS